MGWRGGRKPASALTESSGNQSSSEINLMSFAKMISSSARVAFKKTAGIWAAQRKLHVVTLLEKKRREIQWLLSRSHSWTTEVGNISKLSRHFYRSGEKLFFLGREAEMLQ